MASDNAGLAWHNKSRQLRACHFKTVSPEAAPASCPLLGCLVFFFTPPEKNKLFRHLRVKCRAQSFQYRFVQSCHPFARIQMVEHSSPWTVRNPLDLATLAPHSSLVSFSTVRLKALWSVCGHRCRRHSGSGFWKCVAHRSSTLCVSSGVSDMQFRIKPYGTV